MADETCCFACGNPIGDDNYLSIPGGKLHLKCSEKFRPFYDLTVEEFIYFWGKDGVFQSEEKSS
jgi:hypothetical protein